MTRATVVTVTYQHAAFIEYCIGSVLAQTMHDWEMILVDDGSTDGTAEIAESIHDPKITVLRREHQGIMALGSAYALALEHATSPFIAVLEGDDAWPRTKLEDQLPLFDDPAVVLSYGPAGLMDQFGCFYARCSYSAPGRIASNEPVGSILPALAALNFLISPTVMVRRQSLVGTGGFLQPEGVPYLDHPTWLLLAGQGAFAYHTSIVGSWRRHPAQWTTVIVESGSSAPEEAYLGLAVERLRGLVAGPAPLPPDAETIGRHSERAMVNRWRLALLSAGPGEILRSYVRMIRPGRPRLIGLAIAGLAARGVGSDLEWLQIRRHRVAWPSRRHMRRHRRRSALPTKATERSSR